MLPGSPAYGKRFIVRAEEILTAFVELQRANTRVRGEFGLVIAAQKACARMNADGVMKLEAGLVAERQEATSASLGVVRPLTASAAGPLRPVP